MITKQRARADGWLCFSGSLFSLNKGAGLSLFATELFPTSDCSFRPDLLVRVVGLPSHLLAIIKTSAPVSVAQV